MVMRESVYRNGCESVRIRLKPKNHNLTVSATDFGFLAHLCPVNVKRLNWAGFNECLAITIPEGVFASEELYLVSHSPTCLWTVEQYPKNNITNRRKQDVPRTSIPLRCGYASGGIACGFRGRSIGSGVDFRLR